MQRKTQKELETADEADLAVDEDEDRAFEDEDSSEDSEE